MSDDENRDWEAATWAGSERARLRRALQMSVRERLQALEDLVATGRHLAKKTREQHEAGVRAGARGVAERQSGYAAANEVALPGCSPVPLGAYLKALGVLRLVAEQADPDVRGYWRGEQFVFASRLDQDALLNFFLTDYVPTPILAPWNGGSGFFPGDNASGIAPIRSAGAQRFQPLRRSVLMLDQMLANFGVESKPAGAEKAALLARIRAEADEALLTWLDAATLLSEADPKYPPLLGTGGNDGRLDFTNNFLQRLVELIDPETGETSGDGAAHLRAALFGASSPGLVNKAIGQFMPGSAGGPNASSGFEGSALINPWDFILMLEGAVLFAATATRRHAVMGEGQLSYPFTVKPTGAGSGSTALADEAVARAEIWMPLWERPLSLAELGALLGEGRVTLGRNGRAVRDGLDFARAVAALGVERGISAFQRYAFMMRSGKAYLATPLNRVPVRRNPEAELIDQLESNQFLPRFRRFARGDGASGEVKQLARRLEDVLFDLAVRASAPEQERPRRVQAVLEVLGALLRAMAVSRKAREACPRLPRLDARWVAAADDRSPEFRVAAALAGLGTDRLPMLHHIVPVSEQDPISFDEGSSHVVWQHGSLERNLAAVVARRCVAAEQGQWPDKPFAAQPATDLEATSSYLAGDTDDRRIARLLCGLALVHLMPSRLAPIAGDAVLPAAYLPMKLLFTPDAQLRRVGVLDQDRRLPLPPEVSRLLMADRTDAALKVAVRRLRASGLATGWAHLRADGVPGPRLLAALLIPISDTELRRLNARLTPRERSGSETEPA